MMAGHTCSLTVRGPLSCHDAARRPSPDAEQMLALHTWVFQLPEPSVKSVFFITQFPELSHSNRKQDRAFHMRSHYFLKEVHAKVIS